jgi:Protease inhibitor Inh
MNVLLREKRWMTGAAMAAAAVMLAALAGCTATPAPQPPQAAAAPPPPPPPTPPPIDMGGKWRLSAAAGGACTMTFGNAPAATQGTIAPAGGCPDNFYTSRKWTYERDMLVIHDHKGEALGQLSFTGGHFEGQAANGGTLTLSR